MKRAIHARKPDVKDGKRRGEFVGVAWCGAKSRRTDTSDRVTCGRCVRLMTKRTWVPS